MYKNHHKDCGRPYNDILYIIVCINHYLSKSVEDQAVLPHHDRGHQSPHTQHIVGLGGDDTGSCCYGNLVSWDFRYGSYFEPRQVIRIYRGLDDDAEVHEVAEVQHEEVILLSVVILEPADGR